MTDWHLWKRKFLPRLVSGRRVVRQPSFAVESLEARRLLAASVVTYHNDSASTGVNSQEILLTPANVNSQSFGKVFTTSLDGFVYAQPLFLSALSIPAQGVHDVVFAATEHDSVYALDGATGSVLWHVSLLTSGLPGATSITTVPSANVNSTDIVPEIGITGTPVIDPSTRTLYVVSKTKEIVGGVAHYVQRLHAIDCLNGTEKFGGPVLIGDTTFVNRTYTNQTPIFVNGTGVGNDGHGHVFFNALRENQRTALSLVGGRLYVSWASHGDNGPYHGWIAAYDPGTLALKGVFNDTPNGGLGGIWESGGSLSSDAQGNLYFETGNGTFDGSNKSGVIKGLNAAGFPARGDYGDSFVKLAVDTVHASSNNQNINGWGLTVVDYFTPFNQAQLSAADTDLGSGGPVLLPDVAGSPTHPHLLVGAGKQGIIYLLDRDTLGKFSKNKATELTHVVQEVPALNGSFDTPAYFNQQLYYVQANGGVATAFSLPNGSAHLSTTPASVSADTYGFPGSTPVVSANGSANAIVWEIDHTTNQLRAYNATGYNTELYTSGQAAGNRDALGLSVKFTVPTVANGRVYVGTTNAIVGYGELQSPHLANGSRAHLDANAGSGLPIILDWPDAGPGSGQFVTTDVVNEEVGTTPSRRGRVHR
jgi:hypothetical protein